MSNENSRKGFQEQMAKNNDAVKVAVITSHLPAQPVPPHGGKYCPEISEARRGQLSGCPLKQSFMPAYLSVKD